MKKIIVALLASTFMVSSAHAAFTIPSGHVLTTEGEVVHATESDNTARQVEHNGYAVVGGQVVIGVGEDLVSVDIDDLVGADNDEIVEILTTAAIEQSEEVANDLADIGVDLDAGSIGDQVQELIESGALSGDDLQAVQDAADYAQIAQEASVEVADAVTNGETGVFEVNGVVHITGCESAADCDAVYADHLDNGGEDFYAN